MIVTGQKAFVILLLLLWKEEANASNAGNAAGGNPIRKFFSPRGQDSYENVLIEIDHPTEHMQLIMDDVDPRWDVHRLQQEVSKRTPCISAAQNCIVLVNNKIVSPSSYLRMCGAKDNSIISFRILADSSSGEKLTNCIYDQDEQSGDSTFTQLQDLLDEEETQPDDSDDVPSDVDPNLTNESPVTRSIYEHIKSINKRTALHSKDIKSINKRTALHSKALLALKNDIKYIRSGLFGPNRRRSKEGLYYKTNEMNEKVSRIDQEVSKNCDTFIVWT